MAVTFKNSAAQGDLLLRKVDKLPDGFQLSDPENGKHILAHSETSHHHSVRAEEGVSLYVNDNNPLIAYLVVDNEKCLVEHERSFDTHKTIEVKKGIWEIRRQREYTPEGWRRAID